VTYVRSIPVRDANGDQVILHEFAARRLIGKVSRLQLDSGEDVERLCNDTFVISATGERLTRVR